MRIKVRLFAGWNYPKDITKQANWVKAAYDDGVPMGGDLSASSGTGGPTFVVQAIKDPDSGILDRVQIIKIATKNVCLGHVLWCAGLVLLNETETRVGFDASHG